MAARTRRAITGPRVCPAWRARSASARLRMRFARTCCTRLARCSRLSRSASRRIRQGYDVGSSYRSEIFYASDEQRRVAEDTIADVEASGLWPGTVVTEVSEAVPFWEAEPEHQDYLQRYPDGYTCHFSRPGWKLPHRETAA